MSILDEHPFPFDKPDGKEVHRLLATLYKTEYEALQLTLPFRIDPLLLPKNLPPLQLWDWLLDKLANLGHVREVVRKAVDQHPNNKQLELLRTLLAQPPANHSAPSLRSASQKEEAREIVFVATEWGPAATGVNAINYRLCCALAETHPVKCLVLENKSNPVSFAAAPTHRVELLQVPVQGSSFLAREAVVACEDALAATGDIGAVRIVIGHDIFTGDLATQLARLCECPCALLVYATYSTQGVVGYSPAGKQRDLLQRAGTWFAVGADVHAALVSAAGNPPQHQLIEFIPGLTEDDPMPDRSGAPRQIGIVGRLENAGGAMRQGNFAVAAAAYASRLSSDEAVNFFAPEEAETGSEYLDQVRIMAGQIARSKHTRVEGYGFVKKADPVVAQLSDQSVMLVTTSERGFGLSAWAAIDAGIPLVVWDRAGVATFLREQGLVDRVHALPIEEGLAPEKLGDITARLKVRLVGNETKLSALPPEFDAWTSAVLDVLSKYDTSLESAAELRQRLMQKGFGWRDRARLFAAALPSVPARQIRRPPPKRPSRAIAIFKQLIALSDQFAEGVASRRNFRQARDRGELALFDKMVHRGSAPLPNAVDAVARAVRGTHSSNLSVTGLPGTGKSLFLSSVYWHLGEPDQDHAGILPLFLDCDHPQFRRISNELRGLKEPRDLAAFRARLEKRRPVLLLRGDRSTVDPTREWIALTESEKDCVRLSATRVRSTDQGRGDWEIQTLGCAGALARDHVRLASRFGAALSSEGLLDKATATLEQICRTHRLNLSYALAEICLVGMSHFDERRAATFSAMMYQYGRKRFAEASVEREGQDGERFDVLMKELLNSAAETAHMSITRDSRQNKVPAAEAIPAAASPDMKLARSLIDLHPSVRHWLAASHISEKLIELGGLASKAVPNASDQDRMAALCRSLNFVYPTYVNAFVKEVVDARLPRNRDALDNALNAILTGHIESGRILKASVCYIVGRMRNKSSIDQFRPRLEQVISDTRRSLAEIEALRQAVLAAQREGATRVLNALKEIVEECSAIAEQADLLHKLNRAQKETLLLQRSAYISLGNLGDRDKAEEYVISLLADAQRDDLNRGFHLEYYGDIDYRPGDPLLSTDKDLCAWPRTLDALLAALGDSSRDISAQLVPAVTLASLARHRHCHDKLGAADRERVIASLRQVRRLRAHAERVGEFIDSVIKELEHDTFVIERYVDDIYELKYQRRAGWRDLAPPESVAAHSYMAEFLAKLFVPEGSSVDRQRVLEHIEFHDIGEAIVGDIERDKKDEKTRANEATVVRQISQLGALTRSAEFLRLAARFDAFERDSADLTAEVKIAKDCDRLDLLIQLFRYQREGNDVPRFAEFRADVEPTRFKSDEMQRWAERFIRYFEQRPTPAPVQGNGGLWLTEINRQRIGTPWEEKRHSR